MIPETVIVHGGLRCISEEQQNKARARMKAIAAKNLPHTSAEIRFEDGYPAMAPTDENKALLGLYDKVSRDLGLGANSK